MTALVFRIGVGTCGLSAGAAEVRRALEETLAAEGAAKSGSTVKGVGCLGLCFAEPLVEVGGVLYGRVKPEDARLIAKAALEGEAVAAKALAKRDKCVLKGAEKVPPLSSQPFWALQFRDAFENCGVVDPKSIDDCIAAGGYEGLRKALKLKPAEVVAQVKAVGLRGRGGAGFPTAIKWELCAKAPAGEKFAICNADEGDPGAFMNRANLEGDPHKVLEGLIIAGYACGAGKGFVYVRAEKPLAAQSVKTAVEQAQAKGFLGKNILGSGFDFDVEVRLGAGAFVCGEETALIASIEGKRGMPRARPPYPAEHGLWGKPTNINNVETLAHVPNIFRRGAEWFAARGTAKSKGTKVFCMTGKISNTGAFEVPIGITLRDMVFKIGGGIPDGRKFKAAQSGGPSGGCLPESCLDLQMDYESLSEAGAIMGSGGLVILDDSTCMVDVARYFLTFTQSESCGLCTPCREGTVRMLDVINRIADGKGKASDVEELQRMGRIIRDTSLCGLGQTAPNPVLSTIRYFRAEYGEHVKGKKCPAGVCRMGAKK
ncbi:NADH dehydrogenase [Candidatus Micrarchaeota archaeon CG1_02_60_51]|nr:MAG: NADH dehydrogenase [Candidatus Micrarchaeota archaeon CG1_02_60_51]